MAIIIRIKYNYCQSSLIKSIYYLRYSEMATYQRYLAEISLDIFHEVGIDRNWLEIALRNVLEKCGKNRKRFYLENRSRLPRKREKRKQVKKSQISGVGSAWL